MTKNTLPDFITPNNFNDETLAIINAEKNVLWKLSSQSSYQKIIGLFKADEELEEISLSVEEEYDDQGGDYLSLTVTASLFENDEGEEYNSYELGSELHDSIMSELDSGMLSAIKDCDGISFKKNDVDSLKTLAAILFGTKEDADLYFDIISNSKQDISPNDFITDKNISASVEDMVQSRLDNMQDLDCQIAVMSIRNLFNEDQNLKSISIDVDKDECDGSLYLAYSVKLYEDDGFDIDDYGDTIIKNKLDGLVNGRMLDNFGDGSHLNVKRDSLNDLKKLSKALFSSSDSANKFVVALEQEKLDSNITNTNKARSKVRV